MMRDRSLYMGQERHDAEIARRQLPSDPNMRIVFAAIDVCGWIWEGEDLRQWPEADEAKFLADWQALRDAVAAITTEMP
ncbi:hypothetical protein [Oerskovia enterophila]|uniref:Uncharacterized protein n=1 Tax=Oerskovia enterophila TaxID=43678 RepID=A0ABX2Y3E6_9CELL|nr:hypothetical protein [Oerskovia enterophila]OCI31075.1 hypothetical protein OERS_22860 [Oerskovia enterophila]